MTVSTFRAPEGESGTDGRMDGWTDGRAGRERCGHGEPEAAALVGGWVLAVQRTAGRGRGWGRDPFPTSWPRGAELVCAGPWSPWKPASRCWKRQTMSTSLPRVGEPSTAKGPPWWWEIRIIKTLVGRCPDQPLGVNGLLVDRVLGRGETGTVSRGEGCWPSITGQLTTPSQRCLPLGLQVTL